MISKPPHRRRYLFTLSVLVMVTVAGCDEREPAGDSQGSELSDGYPASANETPPELIRATGTVTTTEPGCLLLDTISKRYQLLGDKAAGLKQGQEVTVTGVVDPDIPSTCPESVALTVSDVVPAG